MHKVIAQLSVPVAMSLFIFACGLSSVNLTPVPTLLPTPVSSSTSTLTVTPPLPTLTLASTPSRPNAPENLQFTHRCLGQQVDIILSWEDKSDNESGFEIFKNRSLIATLDADSTQYTNSESAFATKTVKALFEVRAFNDAGKSAKIRANFLTTCK